MLRLPILTALRDLIDDNRQLFARRHVPITAFLENYQLSARPTQRHPECSTVPTRASGAIASV